MVNFDVIWSTIQVGKGKRIMLETKKEKSRNKALSVKKNLVRIW